MKKTAAKKPRKTKSARSNFWELRLYIAGQTPNSIAAITNLQKICEDQLAGKYRIEVIDLLKKPQLAKGDQIVAIPTLGAAAAATGEENRGESLPDRAYAGGIGYSAGRLMRSAQM